MEWGLDAQARAKKTPPAVAKAVNGSTEVRTVQQTHALWCLAG